jgi:hypothetical protein
LRKIKFLNRTILYFSLDDERFRERRKLPVRPEAQGAQEAVQKIAEASGQEKRQEKE